MKILCVSLGCDKNLVDTEMMLGLLTRDGYTFTDDEQEADIIVINTCCFIGDAKEESVNTILEMAELKTSGSCKALIVTGCMAQRYKQEILKEIPEVDGILGTSSYDEISDVLKRVLEGESVSRFEDLDRLPEVAAERVVTTGGHYAFLKIAEGCDKRCTYCIIPSLRGSYRSVPMEDLVAEAESLAATGRPGTDPGGPGDHPVRRGSLWKEDPSRSCLRRLAAIPGIYGSASSTVIRKRSPTS